MTSVMEHCDDKDMEHGEETDMEHYNDKCS